MSNFRNIICISFICLFALTTNLYAQRNSINGHVFGEQRLPLENITVELVDDFSKSLGRVRTNSAGFYSFSRMPAGVYRIRILPYGTNYTEAEERVQIQNITRVSGGNTVTGAPMNLQRDFYLRVKNRRSFKSNETIFAQDVPKEAEKLYKEAIDLLKDGETKSQGYNKLIAAIESFPIYYMAIEKLGLEYIAKGYLVEAKILLQRAVQIHPKSYKAWYGLGFTLYSLKVYTKALNASKQALALKSRSTDALLLVGTLLRIKQKFKKAEEYLIKAKKLAESPNAQIHWQLALLYGNNLKRYSKAADELELFLKHQPDSKDASKIKKAIDVFRAKSKNS